MDSDSDNNDNFKVADLSPEVFEKIQLLQEKHDTEIELLASELNLQSHFIKDIMKDYRAPAIKKPRKISGFNVWQNNWWENVGKSMQILDSGAQQMCASSWKELNDDNRIHFENEAKKLNNLKDNESYIINAKARKTKLDKAIQEMRKMFRLLQVTCGMEFIAITVSNNSELRSHWFGSSIGEEFYHSYNILNEAIVPFRCFSILKKQEKDGVIKSITGTSNNALENIMDPTNPESTQTLLNDINYAKPNSRETRDKVRTILRKKFDEDVQGGIIPYKNWKEQILYKIVGWPSDVEFKDYANLKSDERSKVLESLDNIKFGFQ
ncbi:unnamed protein product [Rhizophagus irregularis]|nr:unnamed protein product [Rhizophagus irregularis]